MSPAVVAPEPSPGTMPPFPLGALCGRRIVVTRPQAQAIGLSERIRDAGGIPVWFPTIDIEPLRDNTALRAVLARLAQFDLAVFVSANAVACAWPHLAGAWPAPVRAAATGPGTAAALGQRGVADVLMPPARFDSEGLVAELDRLGFSPRQVLIVKGEGGRKWLADTLRARGIGVETVASYRRTAARPDPRIVGDLAEAGQLDGVVVSSSEGADHLFDLLGASAAAWLNRAPVFAPHERIAAHLRARGLSRVVLTAGGDAGLVEGMLAHFRGGAA